MIMIQKIHYLMVQYLSFKWLSQKIKKNLVSHEQGIAANVIDVFINSLSGSINNFDKWVNL